MQAKYLLAGVGVVGAGALALTQLGNMSQDRQYKKTLAYMHEGRDKIQQKMDEVNQGVQNAVNKK